MPALFSTSESCRACSVVSHSQSNVFHVYSCGPTLFFVGVSGIEDQLRCTSLITEHWRSSLWPGFRNCACLECFLRLTESAVLHLLAQNLLRSCGQIGCIEGEVDQLIVIHLAVKLTELLAFYEWVGLHGEKYSRNSALCRAAVRPLQKVLVERAPSNIRQHCAQNN